MSAWRSERVTPACTGRDVVVLVDKDGTPSVQRFPCVGYLVQRDRLSGRLRHVLAVEGDDYEAIPVDVALDDPLGMLPTGCQPGIGVGVYASAEPVPMADLVAARTRLAALVKRMESACV